jgi:hypothetical protein
MNPSRVRSFACFLTFAVASLLAQAQTSVPYIGCPGAWETGPYAAAKGEPKRVDVSPATANEVAWHEYNVDTGRFGMLGPRDCNCSASTGSNGWTLYIAPAPLDSAKLLEHKTGRVHRASHSASGFDNEK